MRTGGAQAWALRGNRSGARQRGSAGGPGAGAGRARGAEASEAASGTATAQPGAADPGGAGDGALAQCVHAGERRRAEAVARVSAGTGGGGKM
jgi:hypothetical protein